MSRAAKGSNVFDALKGLEGEKKKKELKEAQRRKKEQNANKQKQQQQQRNKRNKQQKEHKNDTKSKAEGNNDEEQNERSGAANDGIEKGNQRVEGTHVSSEIQGEIQAYSDKDDSLPRPAAFGSASSSIASSHINSSEVIDIESHPFVKHLVNKVSSLENVVYTQQRQITELERSFSMMRNSFEEELSKIRNLWLSLRAEMQLQEQQIALLTNQVITHPKTEVVPLIVPVQVDSHSQQQHAQSFLPSSTNPGIPVTISAPSYISQTVTAPSQSQTFTHPPPGMQAPSLSLQSYTFPTSSSASTPTPQFQHIASPSHTQPPQLYSPPMTPAVQQIASPSRDLPLNTTQVQTQPYTPPIGTNVTNADNTQNGGDHSNSNNTTVSEKPKYRPPPMRYNPPNTIAGK